MPYQYVTFDGVDLPLYNHKQAHAPMPSESALMDSIGGAFDWISTETRKGRKQAIALTGVYVFGEDEYLVDETGDFLVDETGDFLIAGSGPTMLRSQVAALMAKKGVRGQLVRRRLDDDAEEWKTARLLQVQWPRTWDDHALRAELTCQFESAMENWHAETLTNISSGLSNGLATNIAVENVGETVEDAYLYVTRSTGTITAFSLVCAELGIGLQWTGSYTSGTLVIDDGLQTVTLSATGLDAYSGFSLVNHTAPGWLTLPQGMYTFTAAVLGGNATLSLRFYQQFK